jgi:hypothetical protein
MGVVRMGSGSGASEGVVKNDAKKSIGVRVYEVRGSINCVMIKTQRPAQALLLCKASGLGPWGRLGTFAAGGGCGSRAIMIFH